MFTTFEIELNCLYSRNFDAGISRFLWFPHLFNTSCGDGGITRATEHVSPDPDHMAALLTAKLV